MFYIFRWLSKALLTNNTRYVNISLSHLCFLLIAIFWSCLTKYFINPWDFSSSYPQKCLTWHRVTHSYPFYHSANKFTKLNRHLSEMTVMHPLRVCSKSYSRNTSFIRTCFECSSSDLFIIFKFFKLLCKHSTSKSDVWLSLKIPKCSSPVPQRRQAMYTWVFLLKLTRIILPW